MRVEVDGNLWEGRDDQQNNTRRTQPNMLNWFQRICIWVSSRKKTEHRCLERPD